MSKESAAYHAAFVKKAYEAAQTQPPTDAPAPEHTGSRKDYHSAFVKQAYSKKAAWKVCPECEGEGKTLNPAFRGQWDEDLANDPDFHDEVSSGMHNVTCPKCHGKRVVEDSPEAEQADAEDQEWQDEIRNEERMLGNSDYF